MRIPDGTEVIERGQQGAFRWTITRNEHSGLHFALYHEEALVGQDEVLSGDTRECNSVIQRLIDQLSQEDGIIRTDRSTIRK